MSYYRWDHPETKFSELAGKTLTEVRGAVGDDKLEFVCADGSLYAMWHSQGCCESVSVDRNAEFAAVASWWAKAKGGTPLVEPMVALALGVSPSNGKGSLRQSPMDESKPQ